jgi:histone demethylase JARID1
VFLLIFQLKLQPSMIEANNTAAVSLPAVPNSAPSAPRVASASSAAPSPKSAAPVRPLHLIRIPEFRPTEAEFKNPMKYIASIRTEAQRFGLAKIIPPSDKWLGGTSFMSNVNQTTFLFPTKLQALHQLQLRSKSIAAQFVAELEEFHEQRGTSLQFVLLDGQDVDYYRLYLTVMKLGGYEKVRQRRRILESE